MVKVVARKYYLAQNSPKELPISFKGKIKTRGANLDQESRRETLQIGTDQVLGTGRAMRVPDRRELDKKDCEHIYSHLAPSNYPNDEAA